MYFVVKHIFVKCIILNGKSAFSNFCKNRRVVRVTFLYIIYNLYIFLPLFRDAWLISKNAWWRHQMEHFPRYWPFVRGIHRSAVNSPHKGHAVTRSFDVFFDWRLKKRLSKQSWGWWFEAPSRPLWRHCNRLTSSQELWIVIKKYSIFVVNVR